MTIFAGVGPVGVACAAAMSRSPSPRSAGILFAILPLAGAIGLGFRGQPVIGLVGGLALAAVLTTLFWLADRRR
ncbi:hypothetical protein SCH01S_51_00860 [Sphingomonas changbaiensis NBRC 104936]|uniref:Uncharacterized protein n=1 Tax=Sphingomonas changbaiensis NBRC 104936 TaxID=1219043 RepID=A0A0E9MT48_9SPHN|nr:hypothetical protein [Sphingomonas changbaiensis]GAO40754.1 hypothetical protein SCH01S_51_00860 [Sphingomonas changbaiensis NBRC 104936]